MVAQRHLLSISLSFLINNDESCTELPTTARADLFAAVPWAIMCDMAITRTLNHRSKGTHRMPDITAVLNELIALSRSLGDPARDLAILGEGNTSALVNEDFFLVKASGKELRTADEGTFVAVSMPRALAVLDGRDLTD